MKKIRIVLLSALLSMMVKVSVAQKFLPAFDTFSSKKESLLVNLKGDTIRFFIKDLDRKKGLIVNVEGKTVDGNKFEYKAEEITFMALPPSDYAKLSTTSETVSSINRIQKRDTKELSREYALFYQEYLADKERTVLLQLVNPDFCEKIRVYDDPFASKTGGVSYGGMQLTGGDDKSFYVKWSGKTERMKKKEYDDKALLYYANCSKFKEQFKKIKWSNFEEHVLFNENCE
jgi:hypothetical protein